jgi:hypothetical protein
MQSARQAVDVELFGVCVDLVLFAHRLLTPTGLPSPVPATIKD